ncbi:MAG TPA: hypothetical protein VGN00_29500 [Puia sp.]|jgi:hypothetical protein
MFSLTQLYRADYKNTIWFFKMPDGRDLHAVSEWLTASVRGSEAWQRRMHRALLQEFSTTERSVQPMSRIVTASGNHIFWLDIEEISLHEAQLHLTAPPKFLRDNRAALILWRRALKHALSMDPWSHLWVELDISRTAEARALEKLGFKKEGAWYVR